MSTTTVRSVSTAMPRRRLLLLVLAFAAMVATLPGAASADVRVDLPNLLATDDGRVLDTAGSLPALPAGESGAYASGVVSGGVAAALDTQGVLDEAPRLLPDRNQRSIFGADNRTQVTNTTSYPNSAVVHITSNLGGCTGWLYGRDVVATAGHCLHTGGSGGRWADRSTIRVFPGRNGSSTPFGSCGATQLYSVGGWVNSRLVDYDYGMIKLNCSVGNNTGWFGYYYNDSSRVGIWMRITGYPGDKPFGTMWTHADPIRDNTARRLHYRIDTFNGQSGSAVYHHPNYSYCSGPCANGIHTNGVGPHPSMNTGTRINKQVFNNLYYVKYNT